MLNLSAIEHALRKLEQAFPRINMELLDRRDPLDDAVVSNMVEGYALVDLLILAGVNIFKMGELHYWLELNATVLCGSDSAVRSTCDRLAEATEQRFYNQPNGGIADIMDWYALNQEKSVWRRAAGTFIRILCNPQLFIEGNHRTGALIMSYLLANEGRAPFVLTVNNARAFFNPASLFKKARKHSLAMRFKMPGLTSAFADYLKEQENKTFLLIAASAQEPTSGDQSTVRSPLAREQEP